MKHKKVNSKIYYFVSLFLILLIISASLFFISQKYQTVNEPAENLKNQIEVTENSERSNMSSEGEETESGPETEKKYFEKWHEPYGSVIEPAMLKGIWKDINKMPRMTQTSGGVNQWTTIGPNGANVDSAGNKYSGRVLDMRFDNTGKLVIGAASGGLWRYTGSAFVPLCDQITSLAVSTFDIQPGNDNIIVVGTGEPFIRGGTGLWRTSNGGLNWTNAAADTLIGTFYKVRFAGQNTVHAATDHGYFRSDDAGQTWTRFIQGQITDVVVNPSSPAIVYCSRREVSNLGGLYKSVNGGSNWYKVIDPEGQLPTSGIGRTSLSISPNSPNVIYVSIATLDGDMKGIYRTFSDDSGFTKITPPGNIFEGLGGYANVISANPKRAGICLAGGLWSWRTTNYGGGWLQINSARYHADQHAVLWDTAGAIVWAANDGGLAYSNDSGITYTMVNNTLPITQYYNFDVGLSNPSVMAGGSQDNGFMGTTNGGINWKYMSPPAFPSGGDGGGFAIDPSNASVMYGTIGVWGDNWSFHRNGSTNYGASWTELNNGIDPSDQWYTKIRTDNSSPANVYTSSSGFLYYSTNSGSNWLKRNTQTFPNWIVNFSVRCYNSDTIIYVCTDASNGQRLLVQTGISGAFTERSAGITAGRSIRGVTMSPQSSNTAYAIVNGLFASQKVYKTTNRGVSWINISGNLPNVPAGDLVVNYSNENILYLGTEMGCYKSTDAGGSWFRWNDGMPEAAIVTEMKSYIINNNFYVAACTYGRGIWTRMEDNLTAVINNSGVPDKFELHQNFPNPFNPSTKIKFDIPKQSLTKIKVFDILGREAATLVNEDLKAGKYEVEFNAGNYSSGVYFYKIEAGNYKEVKKMILVK
jgi:photosystem II stability/assembly factor-like uncharacterized protein